MDSFSFLTDLALVVATAALAALVCDRFRIPRVLGYITAGLFLGPNTPSYVVSSPATIQTLGSLGLIFLMLSLGMRFNPARIRRTGYRPLIVAALDVSVMIWLGWMAGGLMGWGTLERIFLGVMLCDSSTVVLAKMLEKRGGGEEEQSDFMVAVTVVEDVLAIGLVAVLNGLALQRAVQPEFLAARIYELGVFLAGVLVFGLFLVPRLLREVERQQQEETLLLTMTGLGFLVSYVAQRLELSLALGAFVIGAVIGESPRAARRREPLVRPLQHLFTAVFFVYIGLELDPVQFARHAPLILGLSLLTVAGKTAVCTLASLGVGLAPAQALRAGLGLAQVCEFTLIIAAMGVALKALPAAMIPVATGVVVVTMALNPLLIWLAGHAIPVVAAAMPSGWVDRVRQYSGWLDWLGRRRFDTAVGRVVRRSFWMILLNLLLIASVFGLATFASRWAEWFRWMPHWAGGPVTVFWLGAMAVNLPMYVTVIRKTHALAMMAAELCVPALSGAPWVYRLRLTLANVITSLGVAALSVVVFLLSSALLPGWPVVAVSVAILSVVMRRGWFALGRFYTEWQTVLRSDEE